MAEIRLTGCQGKAVPLFSPFHLGIRVTIRPDALGWLQRTHPIANQSHGIHGPALFPQKSTWVCLLYRRMAPISGQIAHLTSDHSPSQRNNYCRVPLIPMGVTSSFARLILRHSQSGPNLLASFRFKLSPPPSTTIQSLVYLELVAYQ